MSFGRRPGKRVVEALHWAAPAIVVEGFLFELAAGVAIDDAAPEGDGARVFLLLAHLPAAGVAIEEIAGCLLADARSAVALEDEELGDVVHAVFAGQSALVEDEREAGELAVDTHEECVSAFDRGRV